VAAPSCPPSSLPLFFPSERRSRHLVADPFFSHDINDCIPPPFPYAASPQFPPLPPPPLFSFFSGHIRSVFLIRSFFPPFDSDVLPPVLGFFPSSVHFLNGRIFPSFTLSYPYPLLRLSPLLFCLISISTLEPCAGSFRELDRPPPRFPIHTFSFLPPASSFTPPTGNLPLPPKEGGSPVLFFLPGS